MKSFPLCTWKVRPTISGVIIERRDQVLMTCFEPDWTERVTLRWRLGSTKGPFFRDRVMAYFCPRRFTM